MTNIVDDFIELVGFDSVSFKERQTADWILRELKGLGFHAEEDDAASFYGGNAGNIYGFIEKSPACKIPPILLCAHMDVVEPGTGKRAILEEDGCIHSKGDTVLGADDICGILEILYGIRGILKSGKPHGKIEVLFTIGEELYTKGAEVFDYSKIEAKEAYVLDLSGPVGSAARRAPSIISIRAGVKGKASHAGFAPEQGIHAIQIAAKAISRLPMGYVDPETTFNIGTIGGGIGTNIVPESCLLTGEIRSYDHKKALACVEDCKKIFEEEARRAGGEIHMDVEVHLVAYETPKDAPALVRFQKVCERLGFLGQVGSTFGGSDNNSLAKRGIKGLVLSCGMYQVHSTKEYTRLEDLENGAKLIEELLTLE